MADPRRILVFGATGKQGGAAVSALLAKSSQSQPPFRISAVTRNKSSAKAQSLLARKPPIVDVVEGDFDNIDAVFKQIQKPLWGVFLVTSFDPMKGAAVEEQRGKGVVRAAVEAGVKHIVFTSTDRGGQERTGDDPTTIPHWISKYNIEKFIQEKAAASARETDAEEGSKLTYTFLWPVAFYQNISPDFLGRGFVSMWRINGLDRKLQMINTADIGRVAAEAFANADSPEYRNKGISLAGDELSPREAEAIFKEETTATGGGGGSQEMPWTYEFLGRGMRYVMYKELGIMFNWFRDVGFGADVPALRARYPFMSDFRTWLRTDSPWKKSE